MSVDSLLKYARSQIGYVETPTNRNKYGRQFGQDGVFWCMQFVWACFENSNNSGRVPKTASTRDLYARARKGMLGMQWLPKDTTPRPGDLIEFDLGGPEPVNHVGIVESVQGGRIICIEGNTGGRGPNGDRNGGMVARKSRDTTKVVNFVRPKFPGAAPATSTAPVKSTAAAKPKPPPFPGKVIRKNHPDAKVVKQVQARLNVVYKGRIPSNGNAPLKVDGAFGGRTDKAVRDFQTLSRLHVDGEVGKDTWRKLFG